MSSHPEPFTRLRPTPSARERHDRPVPTDLVCTAFGDWGLVAADVWLWQTGDRWSAQEAWEVKTWWDDSEPPTGPGFPKLASYPAQVTPSTMTPDGDYHWWSVDPSDYEAVLWNTAYVAEVQAGRVPKLPEKVARYYVIVERDLVEGDYSEAYAPGMGTDGTAESCIAQLSRELQEGWDLAGIAGFFRVVGREIAPWMEPGIDPLVPDAEWHNGWPMMDNPA